MDAGNEQAIIALPDKELEVESRFRALPRQNHAHITGILLIELHAFQIHLDLFDLCLRLKHGSQLSLSFEILPLHEAALLLNESVMQAFLLISLRGRHNLFFSHCLLIASKLVTKHLL